MQLSNTVQLIEAKDVLPRLKADIHLTATISLWCYTVEPKFFEQLFLQGRDLEETRVLLDYRQRDRLRPLQASNPCLHIRHWQRNRTQHDKSILLHSIGVAWVTTSNLHRGSFMLANNRALRLTTALVVTRMEQIFHDQWRMSEPVERD